MVKVGRKTVFNSKMYRLWKRTRLYFGILAVHYVWASKIIELIAQAIAPIFLLQVSPFSRQLELRVQLQSSCLQFGITVLVSMQDCKHQKVDYAHDKQGRKENKTCFLPGDPESFLMQKGINCTTNDPTWWNNQEHCIAVSAFQQSHFGTHSICSS